MFGENYYLEELNLAPIGDYVPQDDFQQQMAAGYAQQMRHVMVPQQQFVQPFDYVADALRQQQQAMQLGDRQRQQAAQLEQENIRLQRELQEARRNAIMAPTQEELERLAIRAAERAVAAQQPMSPAQREAQRRQLYEEVYNGDADTPTGDGFDPPEDIRSSPAAAGETFAPVPWGTDDGVARVNAGE